jgi:hypothetical protein
MSKPIGNGTVAILLITTGNERTELAASFADIPGLYCGDTDESCEYHV